MSERRVEGKSKYLLALALMAVPFLPGCGGVGRFREDNYVRADCDVGDFNKELKRLVFPLRLTYAKQSLVRTGDTPQSTALRMAGSGDYQLTAEYLALDTVSSQKQKASILAYAYRKKAERNRNLLRYSMSEVEENLLTYDQKCFEDKANALERDN